MSSRTLRVPLLRAAILCFAALACLDVPAQLAKRDKSAPDGPLEIKNESQEPVRVDLVGPKREMLGITCLGPGARALLSPLPRNTAQVHVQMFKGDCIVPKPFCHTSIAYTPELRYAVVRGGGNKCEIDPTQEPPPMLKSAGGNQMCGPSNAWTPVTFTNRYPNHAVWITITSVNRSSNLPDPRRAYCWGPGETRMHCIDPGTVRLMAEVENGRVCAPNLRVLCKTTMEQPIRPQSQMPPAGAFVEIRPNGDNCYWTLPEYGRPPS